MTKSQYKIITDFEDLRAYTLSLIKSISDEQAAIIPIGSSNNLQWHLGHLLLSQTACLYLWAGIPGPGGIGNGKNFAGYFGQGTSPEKWDSLVPDWDALLKIMPEYSTGLAEKIEGHWNKAYPKTFQFMNIKMNSVAESLPFLMAHEGDHIGQIKRLVKAAS